MISNTLQDEPNDLEQKLLEQADSEDLSLHPNEILIKEDNQGSFFLYYLQHPLEFMQTRFRPGSMKGSIFSLTTAIVGAGMISLPEAFYYSGVLWTLLQLCLCAYIGIYTNMLLVKPSIDRLLHLHQKNELHGAGQPLPLGLVAQVHAVPVLHLQLVLHRGLLGAGKALRSKTS